jgi:hypothetical protein
LTELDNERNSEKYINAEFINLRFRLLLLLREKKRKDFLIASSDPSCVSLIPLLTWMLFSSFAHSGPSR